MQYALLFYNAPETMAEAMPEGERAAFLAAMMAWRGELERAGVFRVGLRLAASEAATSLRSRAGGVIASDGPFAETKELLGGFVLIECEDLDAALAYARRCPIAKTGTVEVRPEFVRPR